MMNRKTTIQNLRLVAPNAAIYRDIRIAQGEIHVLKNSAHMAHQKYRVIAAIDGRNLKKLTQVWLNVPMHTPVVMSQFVPEPYPYGIFTYILPPLHIKCPSNFLK